MRILVTGGAGFIGSNFIRYWLKNHPDDAIVNYDKLSYAGNLENLKEIENLSNYSFVRGDVLDARLLDEVLKSVEGVVHFAAESHVTRSENTPEVFFENNVKGTKTLLEAAVKHNIKRFIQISTDEVYGSIENGYFKEGDKELGDGQSSSAYAKSKSQADDIARSFFNKVPVIIVRPTNNFGPFQYPEKALPRWITNAILGEKIKVWGTGSQVRDWLFTEDTARGLDVLWHKAQTSEAYNIGANHEPEHPNLEIAKKVLNQLGKSEELIEMIPDPRPDHDFRYGVDTTKIQALGWLPGNFEDQFKETVRWYKDNESWWRPLKAEAESLYMGKEKK